ncbi:DEAD/DEAH box helicase [Sphingobacterium detergens]|uniref:Superfamily II DNA or RNA helicase n=1 Tax=Sphingobacterium detergens TaxID=1145106 RepID=A0A420ARQ6_SPHD1|nr:DEAD/DEAH box helicase family protein [Sphingobacterium detergens]RKE47100.1 superfamily II DNA or RNA helicase [Sphingobacterium detergens]
MRNLLILPELIKSQKFGKNLLSQYFFPETSIYSTSLELHEGFITVVSNDQRYCIVGKGKTIPSGYNYVLIADKIPARSNIYSLKLQWVKFPGLTDDFDCEGAWESWTNTFSFVEEDPTTEKQGLRKPQIAAIFNVLSHWRIGGEIGTVVMPTGTGKTETMLSLLVADKVKRLLVIVPTDPLREQISGKFLTLGHLQNPKFAIVSTSAKKPVVGVLNENFKTKEELNDFLSKCNVVVSTMDLITAGGLEMQRALAGGVSKIFIDEAHHVKAPSWTAFRRLCDDDKIIQFTATPFRNDGQSLDGEIIFNYSLKKAQDDGYFKKITLIQVNEWDNSKADDAIAEAAVSQLRKDLVDYDHILMARCNKQTRADEVYEIYKRYPDLNPVVIHRGRSVEERKEAKRKILSKEAKIIVCVDMLGEGFDLPNLKIAAFHDIRQSLPITVQLAGRFTRTKFDEKLGNASIVVNLKDADVPKELEEFYALGADWNTLLPRVSTNRINKEIEFSEYLDGFSGLDESKIPFQSLRPALSTVVYKNHTDTWFPNNFQEGISNIDDLDYLFHAINRDKKTLVVITGKKNSIDWGNSKDIYDISWTLYVVHWDTRNNLLFINSSDNAGLYQDLAKAIIGNQAEIVNKINIFKTFYGIERVRLQNVGLKEFLGKNRSFSMHTGFDIEKALDQADKEGSEKAFVFGTGYENGEKVSIGCSYKGRVWSHAKGDIQEFTEWCSHIGSKLIRTDINPNTVLKETLIPNSISMRPLVIPFAVEWDEAVYIEPETRITIVVDSIPYEFYNTELKIIEPSETDELLFLLVTPKETIKFRQVLFNNARYDDYKFEQVASTHEILIIKGKKQLPFVQFLYDNPVTWWFVDGSSLHGNSYVELKQLIPSYPKEQILGWDWTGVNLSNESQHVEPKVTDSIQFKIIQDLKDGDYDIIYDDDYSGEIADIIAIKQHEEFINIQLYHLKYAKAGTVSKRIDDLYEVCGQAMKSINWKFKDAKEFFEHLLRRETKKGNGKTCSRIELGDRDKIALLKEFARKAYPVEFEMFIVQPGLSSKEPSADQLTLLGVVNSYLKTKGLINLTIIGSEN